MKHEHPRSTCTIDGCGKPHIARGWCHMHYKRWSVFGSPYIAHKEQPPTKERFWAKVDASGGVGACWPWVGKLTDGYGHFWFGGMDVPAHRFSYELLIGPIPSGLQLDHICRVRACVNPTHLEPVTLQENVRRGRAGAHSAAKTHCPQGHPYSGDNLEVTRNGERNCRTCRRASSRRSKARRRAATHLAFASVVALIMSACARGSYTADQPPITIPTALAPAQPTVMSYEQWRASEPRLIATRDEAETALIEAGMTPRAAASLTHLAATCEAPVKDITGESIGISLTAVGDNGLAHGPFQIHVGWNPQYANTYLFDLNESARAAVEIWRAQGLSAWSCWR